jgi:hypothetical protein
MTSNVDRLADELARLSLTLFAATVAGSAFIYSITIQFERSGLPTSTWIGMIHAMSLAGIAFILSFFSGIFPRLSGLSARVKTLIRGISMSLFGLGLILLLSVSVVLWMSTF